MEKDHNEKQKVSDGKHNILYEIAHFSDKKGDFLARARDDESKRASGFLHEIEKSGDIREALKQFNEN